MGGIDGISVYSPQEIVERQDDFFVIIGSDIYGRDMYATIARMGFPQKCIYFPAYGRLTGGIGWQYFDVLRPSGKEIFVDAGCYDGMTSMQFLDWCGGDYEKIYAFEANDYMYEVCKEQFQSNGIDQCELIKGACYSTEGEVSFSNEFSDAIFGGAMVSENGTAVTAVTIDGILNGNRATFIKMDIEGSELEALKGAKCTIQNWHPKLAISLYHKPEDLFEIPEYIMSIADDYRYYIRHYSSDIWETVLYAE